jgi:hypothetical protein
MKTHSGSEPLPRPVALQIAPFPESAAGCALMDSTSTPRAPGRSWRREWTSLQSVGHTGDQRAHLPLSSSTWRRTRRRPGCSRSAYRQR